MPFRFSSIKKIAKYLEVSIIMSIFAPSIMVNVKYKTMANKSSKDKGLYKSKEREVVAATTSERWSQICDHPEGNERSLSQHVIEKCI